MQYKLSQCLVDLFASKFVKTHQHKKLLRQFLLKWYAEDNEIFSGFSFGSFLETLLIRFPVMRVIWTITLQAPAVVSHHMSVPSSLISLLDDFYVLVKFFTLLFRKITQVFRKSVRVTMEEVDFDAHVCSHFSIFCKHIFHLFNIIQCFVVT